MNGGAGGLPYVRAIDGLRGAAVAAVLLFHGGAPGISGGFLGVSLFFTLSGYLITQLLLHEHEASGRISLRSFWGRRLRRLAPASLVALAAISLIVLLTDLFRGTAVPGDVAAAATDVANWRFAVAGTTYQDLFTAGPSPVLHFWSLAIEEQFYLLFPLIVAAVLSRLGRPRLPAVLVVLTLLGAVASVVSPDDLAYYGTHTRAPELLVGALLALALPIGRQLDSGPQRCVALGGALAALMFAVLTARTELGSGWLYSGGLPAVSLLSAAVIAAATVPGPVQRAASWAPAVATGRLSYGLYVYHWPLFLLLSEDRTGLTGPALFAARLLATGLVAQLSSVLIENPVRRGIVLRRPRVGGAALTGALALVLAMAMIAVPTSAPAVAPPELELARSLDQATAPPLPVVDVLVVGSVAHVTGWVRAAEVPGIELRVRSTVQAGCPLLVPDRAHGSCRSFAERASTAHRGDPPDLIVVAMGPSERAPMEAFLEKLTSGSRASEREVFVATVHALSVARQVLAAQTSVLPSVPVMFVDTTPGDPLTDEIRVLDLRSEAVTASEASDLATFERDLADLLDRIHDDDQLRVLVIGDSTAHQLAVALDAAGGERITVIWSGLAGCPLIPTDRVRWGRNMEMDTSGCPSATHLLPDAIAKVQPDVVLAAASLAELSEQRYAGTSRWVAPGEKASIAAHDAGMEALQAILKDEGTLTIVATVPPMLRGGLYDGPPAGRARLEAWLGQLRRWDAQWKSVGVVDWASIAVSAEATAGHDLREDAVHFERDPLLTLLAPPFADAFMSTIDALESEARDSGCLVVTGQVKTLDIDRCRVSDLGLGP
ncbi:MAG: acyltransferase family protein [Actinomycetota bacterium]